MSGQGAGAMVSGAAGGGRQAVGGARTFAGEPGSVAVARRWVSGVLQAAGWGDRLVETAVLVVSELVTNALRHTASGDLGQTVQVELLTGTGRVRISVIDAGTATSEPTVPRSCPNPLLPEAPRGLYLISQWAERIGVQGDVRGRIVFVDVAAGRQGNEGPAGALPKRHARHSRIGVQEGR